MKTKETLGYALGGIGHNLIYALFSGYLLVFYTDVFGLSSGFIALLFLVARIFDAVNDPIMGIITDKTKSRFGHYRIWLMIASPVIALSLIACFCAPDLGTAVKGLYCYVSYILLGMSFTAADIPYWALPSVMTADAQKRAQIFSTGSIAGCLASGVGAVAVPILVSAAGDDRAGYLICAIVFALIGIVCYLLCAATTRERLSITRESYSFSTAVKCLVRNKPLVILMAASLFGNLAFQVKVAINAYYGEYALGKYDYITLLSAMLLVGMLIGSVIVPPLVKRFGSKTAMAAMFAGGILISLVYFVSGYQSLVTVLIFSALSAVVIGAVCNIMLDPVFIFGMDMGVAGAALATIISQAASALWVLRFLIGRKVPVPLTRKNIAIRKDITKDICKLGTASFIMQGTTCLVQVACNTTLQAFGGDLYVGIMTVTNSVREIFSLPVMGITNGSQPVISYNYGAKQYQRVRSGIRFNTFIGTAYTMIAWLLVVLFPAFWFGIFSEDISMMASGIEAMKIYFFGFVFMSFQFAGQTTFQALGDAKHAIFFSLLRKAIIVVPLTLLLPRLGFGVLGVFMAEPISNILGGLACYITMRLTVYREIANTIRADHVQ